MIFTLYNAHGYRVLVDLKNYNDITPILDHQKKAGTLLNIEDSSGVEYEILDFEDGKGGELFTI